MRKAESRKIRLDHLKMGIGIIENSWLGKGESVNNLVPMVIDSIPIIGNVSVVKYAAKNFIGKPINKVTKFLSKGGSKLKGARQEHKSENPSSSEKIINKASGFLESTLQAPSKINNIINLIKAFTEDKISIEQLIDVYPDFDTS